MSGRITVRWVANCLSILCFEGGPLLFRNSPFLSRSTVLDEVAGLQFAHGLAELGLGVHDDGAVPGDRFFERLAGDEQEADAFGAGLDGDFVAAIEQDERVVLRVVRRPARWGRLPTR